MFEACQALFEVDSHPVKLLNIMPHLYLSGNAEAKIMENTLAAKATH